MSFSEIEPSFLPLESKASSSHPSESQESAPAVFVKGSLKLERADLPWAAVHNRAVMSARNLKFAYIDLLRALTEVERDEIFYQLGMPNLHQYCVEVLELPRHTAYDFLDVIRTSKEVPQLAEAIYSGRTTISKARRVCSVITPKNQKEWIDAICECSFKLIQKMVAIANPRAAVQERMQFVAADVLEINFAVSEAWAELLTDTKDLLSSRERRAVSTEEAIFILMSEFKQKNDPVKKAECAAARREKADVAKRTSKRAEKPVVDGTLSQDSCMSSRSGLRSERTRYIPRAVEQAADIRDQNRCTHIDPNGRRCETRRWLEKHHDVEFAKGGAHSLGNIATLCSGHHRMIHRLREKRPNSN